MDASTRRLVRQRAQGRREYCRLPQAAQPFLTFHVEHIVAEQHNGSDDPGNLCLACQACNNAKRDKFPLGNGQPLLIDPSGEDPMDFLLWDFRTGRVVFNPNEPNRTRARVTRDLFDLDQEPIREERRRKIKEVLYVLAHVVREEPISPNTIEQLREHLHPSRPWLAIIRQLFLNPNAHSALIEVAREKLPDIDDWTAGWP